MEAHPTYFAGIQEDAIAALINANKRAELIQLAVHALLTMMVAADKSAQTLSRTTRERFLKLLVIEMASKNIVIKDDDLTNLASRFLDSYLFDVSITEFLSPFFSIGLLYRSDGIIYFTHPYLECYLLAEAMRDDSNMARLYFDPTNDKFNYYAFDLYCEMGPDSDVISQVRAFAQSTCDKATTAYPGSHIYLGTEGSITALSNSAQLKSLTQGLMATAERLESPDTGDSVRSDKQRLLDTKRYVKSEVGNRSPDRDNQMPLDLRNEFEILDALSRSLALCVTAVGSGSESLSGLDKTSIARSVLKVTELFSDIWTRNRLRVDFEQLRNDVLSDSNIWKIVEEFNIDENQFEDVRHDLSIFIHGMELNVVLEPMAQILARISSYAGVKVLKPVLDSVSADGSIQEIVRGLWMLDIDPNSGKETLKSAFASYNGIPIFRIVIASHLLWRVFWHHYKTAGAKHMILSAKRALRPLGLAPSQRKLKNVERGATQTSE